MHAQSAGIDTRPDAEVLRYRDHMTHQVESFFMDESSVIGEPEFHQEEALRLARNVRHQYIREAKKTPRRECLEHLVASLVPARNQQVGSA